MSGSVLDASQDETSATRSIETPFRVADLKQWIYCGRILYYALCTPQVRPVTFKMEHGIQAGKEEVRREVRRSLQRYGVEQGRREFNVRLNSAGLGLRGEADLVIWQDERQEAIPVDFKYSDTPGEHFKLQLAAYAVLLEENYGVTVKKGFLYLIPKRQAEVVRINERLRGKLYSTLEAMQRMLLHEAMPPATKRRGRCAGCEFRRFCNDML
jgi:CRISPR-associated exonuclease Cas4